MRIVAHLCGHIDWIANPCEGNKFLQTKLDIVRHRRKRKALRGRFIGDQDARSAGCSDDGGALCLWHKTMQKRIARIEKLLQARSAANAITAKHRIVNLIVSRQRGRVGLCRRSPGRRTPDFQNYNGLARLLGIRERADESGAIAAAFHIAHDDFRLGILNEPIDTIAEIHIGFVSGCDPAADGQAAEQTRSIGIGPKRTALANDAHATTVRKADIGCLTECADGPGRQAHKAQTIWPQNAYPRAAGQRTYCGLHADAITARFRETG